MTSFCINGRLISRDQPPYIIAEVSANHGGSINRAKEIIALAKSSGADAVKIQSYEPHTLTLKSDEPDFLIEDGLWKGYNLFDLYSQAFTPFSWHQELFRFASELNITLFSSPFDESAVDLLESLNAPAYKIASFELCDLPLIKRAAQANKPLLMSTGLSGLNEIEDALHVARKYGNGEILLFHCISSYPAKAQDSCLQNIKVLSDKFNVLVGLSDHTIDNTAAIVSTALGACAIEKHFTDLRANGGVDSSFSIEPGELRALKISTSDAWLSTLGKEFSRPNCENQNVKFKRSLYFCKDLQAGSVLDQYSIKSIRPGYGISPKYFNQILGKRLKSDVHFGQRVSFDCFEPGIE